VIVFFVDMGSAGGTVEGAEEAETPSATGVFFSKFP